MQPSSRSCRGLWPKKKKKAFLLVLLFKEGYQDCGPHEGGHQDCGPHEGGHPGASPHVSLGREDRGAGSWEGGTGECRPPPISFTTFPSHCHLSTTCLCLSSPPGVRTRSVLTSRQDQSGQSVTSRASLWTSRPGQSVTAPAPRTRRSR